jgi:hypothetical protein
MSVPQGWQGILDDDEEIRWQGRPDGAVVWKLRYFFTGIFGLFFAGFALFWMAMAASAGGYFWTFGLIHFSVGIGIAVVPPFGNAWRRRHSWYTLTDRRALIATDLPLVGRKLKSYPIRRDTMLEFDSAEPATIIFSSETRRTKNGTRTVKIGFDRIPDGRSVYALIREIQKAAT